MGPPPEPLCFWTRKEGRPVRPPGAGARPGRCLPGAGLHAPGCSDSRNVRSRAGKGPRLARPASWKRATRTSPAPRARPTQYCDVIGFNAYLPRVDARWDFLKRLDKPAIIGEYNFGALDRGMFYPGVLGASSQADRARMYQEYVRSVADHPDFVGCHFFKYGDEPLTARRDGENFNTGFVTVTDSVYPEMAAAAKAVHAEVYRRRASKR